MVSPVRPLCFGVSAGPGEFAAICFVQLHLPSFGDGAGESDDNPAVAKAVETLTASGGDVSGSG
ncbi:MAG: hypothetical protein R6V83_06625 [Candidatus Thorarchaeota archaeon]